MARDPFSTAALRLSRPQVTPAARELYRRLQQSFKKNPAAKQTQQLLALYCKTVGATVGAICSDLMEETDFERLPPETKVRVIKELMGPGLAAGFAVTAEVTTALMDDFLDSKGVQALSVAGLQDLRRVNSVLKLVADKASSGETQVAQSTARGAFGHLVEAGNLSTVLATGDALKKRGVKLGAIRHSSRAKSCDYCVDRAGQKIALSSSYSGEVLKFHDNCTCYLEVVVTQ